MKATFFFLLLLVSVLATAQKDHLKGRVLDTLHRPLPSIKIINKTSGVMVLSDHKGDFDILVSKKDSIYITSIFFKEQQYRVTKKMIAGGLQLILEDKINELEAVVVVDSLPYFDIDEEAYNTTLNQQLKSDIKNNPGKYGLASVKGSGGIDVLNLLSGIGKLFKRKNKSDNEMEITITIEDLKLLFENSTVFTKVLLLEQLKIPESHIPLFYDFCEVQYWNVTLLEEKNEFQLLDLMVTASQEFLEELNSGMN